MEADKPDWWREAVIYQIYPRSFCDSNGDGVGDLAGITEKLGHVVSLGVDGIWISPFFTSPMRDYGYDVADYTDVDPLFGTLADFDALIVRARDLGLKVIIDQVYSHSSSNHAWFQASRRSRDNDKADWYVWADPKPDGSPPNNWLSIFGGCGWEWSAWRQQYYLHNFLPSQPDLNFHCLEVQDALLDAARFWLERGVDGFRLDVVNFFFHDAQLRGNPPKEEGDVTRKSWSPYSMQAHIHDKSRPETLPFLRRLRSLTDEFGATMMVGEVGDDDPLKIMDEYTSEPGPLHTCYSFALLDPHIRPRDFRSVVEDFYQRSPGGWPSWTFSNHDVVRAVSRMSGKQAGEPISDDFAVVLNAALFSLPGTIFFYQGEELGLPEAPVAPDERRDPVGRDGCRTPMVWDASAENAGFGAGEPWLPIPEIHAERAVAAQEADPKSVLGRTRALLKWRQAQPAMRRGRATFLDASKDCLLILRETEEQKILVAINLTGKDVIFDGLNNCGLAMFGEGAVFDGGRLNVKSNGYGFFEVRQNHNCHPRA